MPIINKDYKNYRWTIDFSKEETADNSGIENTIEAHIEFFQDQADLLKQYSSHPEIYWEIDSEVIYFYTNNDDLAKDYDFYENN